MSRVDYGLVSRVSSALSSAGVQDVCPRCVLRLAAVKDSREHEAVVKKDACPPSKRARVDGDQGTNGGDASEDTSPAPCRACLGVLQDEFMQEALNTVSSAMSESGHDADHFTVAVSLPVSLALRAHSLNVLLSSSSEGSPRVEGFDEDEVVPIKQVWKWLFPHTLQKKLGRRYVTGDDCEFYVDLAIEYPEDKQEIQKLLEMCKKEYAMRQKKKNVYHMGLVTRVGAEKSLAGVSDERFRRHYPVPPEPVAARFKASVKMHHNSIYIAGRYNKYSRELPQTPWVVDGEKRMDTSVEELILDRMKEFFPFDQARFSSSGREDIDVRTLGRGRPFMFEVVNPRRTMFEGSNALSHLQQKINRSSGGRVRVRDLQVVSKSETKRLKEGEDQKTKTYRALCILPEGDLTVDEIREKVEPVKNLELDQRTPVRVLHRRPNNWRKRTVYWMEVLPVQLKSSESEASAEETSSPSSSTTKPPTLFSLRLATQAGTYVKEFVHGDLQRTRPNLRKILGGREVDIVALDVEAIDLDWPPKLEENGESEKEETNGKT